MDYIFIKNIFWGTCFVFSLRAFIFCFVRSLSLSLSLSLTFLMGHSLPLFPLFSSFQYTWQKTFNINFTNDWIWTADLWSQKWPLLQVSHNYCTILFYFAEWNPLLLQGVNHRLAPFSHAIEKEIHIPNQNSWILAQFYT